MEMDFWRLLRVRHQKCRLSFGYELEPCYFRLQVRTKRPPPPQVMSMTWSSTMHAFRGGGGGLVETLVYQDDVIAIPASWIVALNRVIQTDEFGVYSSGKRCFARPLSKKAWLTMIYLSEIQASHNNRIFQSQWDENEVHYCNAMFRNDCSQCD